MAEAALEARNSCSSSPNTIVQIPRAAALREAKHNRMPGCQADIVVDAALDHDEGTALPCADSQTEKKIPVASAGDSEDDEEDDVFLRQQSKAQSSSAAFLVNYYWPLCFRKIHLPYLVSHTYV